MQVEMIVDFMDYKKGSIETVTAVDGARLISRFGVATAVKPRPKKQIDAAPVDKQVKGAAKTK